MMHSLMGPLVKEDMGTLSKERPESSAKSEAHDSSGKTYATKYGWPSGSSQSRTIVPGCRLSIVEDSLVRKRVVGSLDEEARRGSRASGRAGLSRTVGVTSNRLGEIYL